MVLVAGGALGFAQAGQDSRETVPAPAQPASERLDAEAPSFTFKAVTRMAIVQVVVRDKEDNPIRDLTANDLRVSEKIGDSPEIPEKIASFRPINEVVAQQSTKTAGIVLGWLHKSFCPLTGAYELSYYLSPESRKDGLHRVSVTSSRPQLRLFFRTAYKIEADKPAEVGATELAGKPASSQLQRQQLIEAERKSHPELELALIACYDTLNVTNFHLDVRKVETKSADKVTVQSQVPVDSYEFTVPGTYFASLPASERNHPRHLDFSFCKFEYGGLPIRESEGTVMVGRAPEEYSLLSDQGFAHTITVERQRCVPAEDRMVCEPPVTIKEMQQRLVIKIALSARLVVRDRETGAFGTAEILLGPLPKDRFPALIPEGQTNDSFGTADPNTPLAMCGDVYQLAPWTTKLPLFSEIDAVAPLYATSLAVYSRFFTVGIPGVTSRTEWLGINYQGAFGVDRPGKYEFDLYSDDGAKVYIDGKLVVSDDTIHEAHGSRGKIQLDAGAHNIRVSYFQGPRVEVALLLLVKPPGRGWRVFDTRDFPNPEQPSSQRGKLPLPEN